MSTIAAMDGEVCFHKEMMLTLFVIALCKGVYNI